MQKDATLFDREIIAVLAAKWLNSLLLTAAMYSLMAVSRIAVK